MSSFCYIHIPFCESKCKYCRFASVGDIQSLRIAKYVDSLCEEIISSPFMVPKGLSSVYFGGGTPSTLTVSQTEKILSTLEDKYRFNKDIEISFESTPNKIEKIYVKQLQDIGINRLSIGVQSLNEETLKEIGRGDKGDIIGALENIREVDFENISIDFIIGLPHVKKGEIKQDIEYILKHFPFIKHISVYMLEDYYEVDTDEKSKFHNAVYPEAWEKTGIDEGEFSSEYQDVVTFLEQKGFLRYEISNFSKPGYECRHNKAYWNHKTVLAFGLGASGLVDCERYTNSENFLEYYTRKNIGKERLDSNDIFLEKVMFGLRTCGLGKDIVDSLDRERIKDFIEDGFLIFDLENKNLKITDKAVVFLDYIMKEILK